MSQVDNKSLYNRFDTLKIICNIKTLIGSIVIPANKMNNDKSLYNRFDTLKIICNTKTHIGSTVNVLKFPTLISFCSQIKCWFSGLEFTNFLTE